jgi:hypothetical protein
MSLAVYVIEGTEYSSIIIEATEFSLSVFGHPKSHVTMHVSPHHCANIVLLSTLYDRFWTLSDKMAVCFQVT